MAIKTPKSSNIGMRPNVAQRRPNAPKPSAPKKALRRPQGR